MKINVINRHICLLFCFSVVFLLTFFKSWIFALLIVIPILYVWYTKTSFIKTTIYLFLSLIPCLIYFFIKDFNFLTYLNSLIQTKTGFNLRKYISSYLDRSYDDLTSNFIKLMVLNIKIDESYYLYKKIANLSVVYLIVISGFHLMFIKKIFNFLFKKFPKIAFLVNTILFVFYCYPLNFSYSVLRVLLTHLFSIISKKYSNGIYESTSMSGMLCLICFPSSCFSLSFGLSYICTFAVIYVISLEIKNKILEKILINVCAIIISLPMIMSIDSNISLIAIINSFIFSYFFCFVFVYFFMFGFILFLYPIHHLLTLLVFNVVEGFNIINITVSLNIFNTWLTCAYYILFFLIIMITYKRNNFQW